MNATGWSSESLPIKLNWGLLRRPIEANVVTLRVRDSNSALTFSYQAERFDIAKRPLLTQHLSPPLGLPLADIMSMERTYQRYVQSVVKNDLQEYVNVAYDDQESLLPERLLDLVCVFFSSSQSTDRDV